MLKYYLFALVILSNLCNSFSSPKQSFIENKGQLVNTEGRPANEIIYYNNRISPAVYLSESRISLVSTNNKQDEFSLDHFKFGVDQEIRIEKPKLFRVDLYFEGNTCSSNLKAEEAQTHKQNFYLPNCPDGLTNIKSFNSVIYKDVYPDTDFKLNFLNEILNSEFNLRNIDAINNIKLRFDGALEILRLDCKFILIRIKDGEFTFKLPEFFVTDKNNKKSKVELSYSINGNIIEYSDKKEKHDNNLELSEFEWSTFAGGLYEDKIMSCKFDNIGNVIATGFTYSQNFPTTPGVWKEQFSYPADILVMKFSNNGEIFWSTFYGSNGLEFGNAIKADKNNNYWIVGECRDNSFPYSPDAFQKNYNGGTADGIIIKLNDQGRMLYSTYFGGSNYDTFSCLAFDSKNNLWLAARTNSRVYPCTPDAYKSKLDGEYDGVLIQFSNDGKLLYSSYFGGVYDDFYEGIVVDSEDNIIVSGYSSSYNYYTTNDAFQKNLLGLTNAVLTKFSQQKNVIWSTFFGGSSYDYGSNLAIDSDDNLYQFGYTSSDNLPTTANVYQQKFGGGSDCYLAKFDNKGEFHWVTYIGGSDFESETATIYTQFGDVACSKSGQIAFAAKTISKDLKTTSDAFQKTAQGLLDGLFGIMNPDGTAATISYLGGSKIDYALDIDFYQDSMLVIGGVSESPDFPIKKGFQSAFGGIRDGFIVKFGALSGCLYPAFDYTDFKDIKQLNFAGYAHQKDNYVRLTKTKPNEAGAVWFNKKLPLQYGFTTNFSFRFSEGSNNNCKDNSEEGADGIALIIQNSNPYAIGWSGGGIGYDGIKNSIAIEFDTFSNDSAQLENLFDPDGNHIAVQCNGVNENSSKHTEGTNLAINSNIPHIYSDGRTYYVSINYNPKAKTMTVYFDDTKHFSSPVIFLKDFDLSKLINLESNALTYIGITGATGCAFQNQDILSWDLCLDKPFVTSIDNETNKYEKEIVSIYPNPANDRLMIYFDEPFRDFPEIKLTDVMGIDHCPVGIKKYYNNNKSIEIDLRDISSGVYFLKVNSQKNTYVNKIIVTK